MAVNYAKKYSEKAVEKFVRESLTEAGMKAPYEFLGAKTVVVTTNSDGTMNDYARIGVNRYGTPEELQNTQQELTLTKDRAFSLTIDKRNRTEAGMTNEAGAALARQIRNKVVPEVDTYRLAALAAGAKLGNTATAAITSSNAYTKFLDGTTKLNDLEIPMEGRVAWVTAAFLNFLKLDTNFTKASDLAQDQIVIKGQVGMVDGVPIVMVPSGRMPANTAFLIAHESVTAAPIDLADYKVHVDPPGISGWLIEGRIVYDCFTLDTLEDGIYWHKTI